MPSEQNHATEDQSDAEDHATEGQSDSEDSYTTALVGAVGGIGLGLVALPRISISIFHNYGGLKVSPNKKHLHSHFLLCLDTRPQHHCNYRLATTFPPPAKGSVDFMIINRGLVFEVI
ncbi:hypothetical protein L2E82_01842 [Cichorium intybus]|uniref:Uncharacterized protein n=1 Tax=Cichorium intybus TaxID=13427 RepID=A0ACB9H131_CICIN|nr:hypothetical protein L2E82_01842 [Cichorium intybus]